jgi:23S rRNA maturation mini-RNase III
MIHEVNNDILDYINKESPQYNEIQDNAMNEVEKHIHDLSLTFMKPIIPKKENTFSKTFLKSKKDKKAKNSDIINFIIFIIIYNLKINYYY